MSTSVEVKLEPASEIIANLGIEPKGDAHAFFTNECAKAMDKYVPFDKGTLAGTVIQNGKPTNNVTEDTITYQTNYASIVYYGIRSGKEITIHQDKHPQATTYWDTVMWSAQGEDITKRVAKYIKIRGGKK